MKYLNSTVVAHNQIKSAFYDFYAELYKKDEIKESAVVKYLQGIPFKPFSKGDQSLLQAEITQEEIFQAIQSTKVRKAPGPDGITAKFYKELKDDLGGFLLQDFNDIPVTGKIPRSWREANVALIPKEDQDVTEVFVYSYFGGIVDGYK